MAQKRIDFSNPNWPAVAKAQEQAELAKLDKSKSAVRRVRSRHYRMSLDALGTIHNAQDGKCANPGCRKPISAVGRGRAIDPETNRMLCKGCSIALGILNRNQKRLRGLMEYLNAQAKA